MDGFTEWCDVAPKKESTNSSNADRPEYLWLKSGSTYRVRPVHLPVHFYKFFLRKDGKLRTALCEDPKNCSVLATHPELKAPNGRYAIYVIDREDGKLKIMEAPRTVFLPMRKRCEQVGVKPGGKDGGDWAIEVSGSGLKTEYSTTYLTDTPFTDAEKKMINEEFKEDKAKLAKLYKPHTEEQIEKRLFGDWENTSNKGAVQSNTNKSVSQVSHNEREQELDVTGDESEEFLDW
jgi:hypothetical protein